MYYYTKLWQEKVTYIVYVLLHKIMTRKGYLVVYVLLHNYDKKRLPSVLLHTIMTRKGIHEILHKSE